MNEAPLDLVVRHRLAVLRHAGGGDRQRRDDLGRAAWTHKLVNYDPNARGQ
jgi:hypothetical protein